MILRAIILRGTCNWSAAPIDKIVLFGTAVFLGGIIVFSALFGVLGPAAVLLAIKPQFEKAMNEAGVDTSGCETSTAGLIVNPRGESSKCYESTFIDITRKLKN
jgi:hypothetical protein